MFNHAIVGTTQFVVTSSSIDDEGKNHTTLKPTICYFCGKPITAKKGDAIGKSSLVIHSLDGNHDNWDKDNKVSSHYGCHTKFHHTGSSRSEKTKKLMSLAKKGKYCGENNPMYGVHRFGKKNPMFGKHRTEESKKKNREAAKQQWVNITPEERTEMGRKISEGQANMTPEKKAERRRKQSEAMAGRKQTPEHIRNMVEGKRQAKLRRENEKSN